MSYVRSIYVLCLWGQVRASKGKEFWTVSGNEKVLIRDSAFIYR